MDGEIRFKEECFGIIGAAMEVHSELGPGFREPVYQEAYEMEMADRAIPFEAQPELRIQYKGRWMEKTYQPDVLAHGQIVVELKALKKLGPEEEAQLLNYMKAGKYPVGLLINFGSTGRLEWKRYVL